MEIEKNEGNGDATKKYGGPKRDSGATFQKAIDLAAEEGVENNEDNNAGTAASENEMTNCILSEFELSISLGSSMEDQIQSGLCLTTSRLDATDRNDMERVAAETMLELWLRSVNKADDCESSNTSPSSVTSASSNTRTTRQSDQGLFGS